MYSEIEWKNSCRAKKSQFISPAYHLLLYVQSTIYIFCSSIGDANVIGVCYMI